MTMDWWWFVVPFIILGILMLISFLRQVSQMEVKKLPDGTHEPSYKCKCGFDVYVSSKAEYDLVCDKRGQL